MPNKPVFNERNVHTIEPPTSGRLWCWPADPGAPKGFRLMVTAKGYRAYYVVYRPKGGGKSRAHLISPAEDFSYKDAKTAAEKIRGLVADGKDPVGEAQTARERKRSTKVVSVRDVFDYFLEVHRTNSTTRPSWPTSRPAMLSPTPFYRSQRKTLRPRCSASLSRKSRTPRSCRTATWGG